MNTALIDPALSPRRGQPTRTARQRRVRQARAFFIIAVLAAAVSLAGHCLPGDQTPNTGNATTQSHQGR